MNKFKLLRVFLVIALGVFSISCVSEAASNNNMNSEFKVKLNELTPERDKSATKVMIKTVGDPDDKPRIFHYAHNSDYVVVAVMDKVQAIGRVEKKEKRQNILDLGDVAAGFLYSFHTEKILCSKESSSAEFNRRQNLMQEFQIFVPIEQRQKENYAKGQRYLIFLRAIPKQNELTSIYELNKSKNYFEAFEGAEAIFPSEGPSLDSKPKKGIIDMSNPKYQDLIEKIKLLCSALNEKDKDMRIKELQKLTKSSDKQLRNNAIYAIKDLQGS
jgi:hypothetical protein